MARYQDKKRCIDVSSRDARLSVEVRRSGKRDIDFHADTWKAFHDLKAQLSYKAKEGQDEFFELDLDSMDKYVRVYKYRISEERQIRIFSPHYEESVEP